MIESEVPNGCINHAVGRSGHHRPNHGACKTIVPIVEFVNCESSCDEGCTEQGSIESDHLPHGWVVIRENFQFGVDVVVQVEKPRPCCSAVTAGKRLQGVVNLIEVAPANVPLKHDVAKSVTSCSDNARIWIANRKEVWPKTTYEPLQEYLEDRCVYKRIKQADNGVVGVPEAPNANLHTENDEDRNE